MRDNINVNSSLRLFESYKNFVGGLNTEQSNEVLKDSETTILQNVDTMSRGSMRRREGYQITVTNSGVSTPVQNVLENTTSSGGQGVFKYKLATDSIIVIVAHGGVLYSTCVSGLSSFVFGFQQIYKADGTSWTFQTTDMIDAVQYNSKMYVVTGSRIGVLTYDSTKASKFYVEDLVPTVINEYQASYVGYNLYASGSDITNIFYNKFSPVPDTFVANISCKGVIDKTAKVAPDYKFCSHNATAGSTTYTYAADGFNPVTGFKNSGYDYIIIGIQISKGGSYTVDFQKYDGTTWTAVAPVGSVATSTSVQGTYTFDTSSVTFKNFRVIVTRTSGYITVRAQPKFILRDPMAGDTVRFAVTWEAYQDPSTGSIPLDPPDYQYQWEVKKSSNESYPATPVVPFGTGATSAIKEYLDYTLDAYGEYDFRAQIRHKTSSKVTNYAVLSPFIIAPSTDKLPKPVSSEASEIVKCTRCLVHWNRLILYYGDINLTYNSVANPNRIYISELDDFGYFPRSGYIDLVTDAAQPVTSILRHRNQLVLFTPSSIYTMTGKSPADYTMSLINDRIGCDMPWTPTAVENDILFANSDGVFRLRPSTYILDNFNVIPISDSIVSEFLRTAVNNASRKMYGFFFNDQYHLANMLNSADVSGRADAVIYKYNSQIRAWSTDTVRCVREDEGSYNTIRVGMMGAFVHRGRLVTLFCSYLSTGSPSYTALYRSVVAQTYPNIDVYVDMFNHIYTMLVQTKFFDFSASFNKKKLRRIYLMAKTNEDTTVGTVKNIDLSVKVEADGAAVLDPEIGTVQNVFGTAVWTMTLTPNFHFSYGAEIGAPPSGNWVMADPTYGIIGAQPIAEAKSAIRGKCLRIRLTVNHTQGVPCEVVAAGFEFRLKQP